MNNRKLAVLVKTSKKMYAFRCKVQTCNRINEWINAYFLLIRIVSTRRLVLTADSPLFCSLILTLAFLLISKCTCTYIGIRCICKTDFASTPLFLSLLLTIYFHPPFWSVSYAFPLNIHIFPENTAFLFTHFRQLGPANK